MRVSKVEVVVLGLLAEEPRHGYDLLERFRARSMGFWVEVGKASVYQALRRLEAGGLIAGRAQEGTEGPDRRVYRLTRAGRDRLRAGLLERVGSPGPYETPAGEALGFAHLLPAGDAREAAAARERTIRERLQALAAERARTRVERGRGRVTADRMLDLQEALAEAELAWLGSFKRTLSRLRG